jgi:parvulin-like peptidyl-prolyl isomerase
MNGLKPKESKQNQNMKTKNKMIFSAVLAAALITLPRAQAATSGAATPDVPAAATATNSKPADVMASLFGDPVIVKGKGFEIKQSQLEGVTDAYKAKAASTGQTVPTDEITRIALNSLIVNQILLQKATDADKVQGKTEADQYIAQRVKQFGSQALVEEQLKAIGKTFEDWRKETTDQITAQAVMIRELNAAPTDAEVKKYYDDHPSGSEVPEQVHVRHILLLTIDTSTQSPTPLPDDQIKAKKKKIDDILKRARAGEGFAKLAKESSEDPGSKDNGGEMLPFSRNDPVAPEFMAAAFSLTNNQISDVVTTQYGYHIIQLLDKIPPKKLTLTDKLPASDTTLADYLKELLTGNKLKEQAPAYIEKLSKSPGVEILDPVLKALMSASTNAPAAAKP